MKKYIAYYRVSTKAQKNSGLGLDAQRHTIENFIEHSDQIVQSYTDIESGNNNNRHQLTLAIDHAKSLNATLLIAKLDRLSRNVSFIFALKDSEVDFVCCDLPEANTLTIGIFATMAQHERELISKRTKAALAAKKAQGHKLGNPNGFTIAAKMKASITLKHKAKTNTNTIKALAAIKDIKELAAFRGEELTKATIADKLNNYGLTTPRNKKFDQENIRYLLAKVS